MTYCNILKFSETQIILQLYCHIMHFLILILFFIPVLSATATCMNQELYRTMFSSELPVKRLPATSWKWSSVAQLHRIRREEKQSKQMIWASVTSQRSKMLLIYQKLLIFAQISFKIMKQIEGSKTFKFWGLTDESSIGKQKDWCSKWSLMNQSQSLDKRFTGFN